MPDTTPVNNNLVARMLPNGMLEVRDSRTNEIIQGARLANADEQAATGNQAVVLGDESQEVIRDTPDEVIYREGPFRTVYRYDKKTNTREEWTLQEEIPDDVKRPFAGAVSAFVDSPGDAGINGYLPSGLEAVPAGMYQLYNLAADHSLLPSFQNDYLDRASVRTQQADQSLRDALDLSLPSTPLDYALEITGSLAVPAPKLSRLTDAANVVVDHLPVFAGRTGGVVRNAIDAAGSGIGGANIFGRQGGLIHDAGAVVGETLLPLRQGNLATAAATQIPLGVGVAETIDTGQNTENYTGIVDAIDKATTYQPTAYDAIPQDAIDMFEAETDPEVQAAMAVEIQAAIDDGTLVAPDPEVPAWRHPGVTALAGLGIFAGGAVGLRMATANARAARMAPAAGQNLAGRRRLMEGSSLSSRIMGGIAQGDQVLRDMIRASGGSEDVVNRLTRNTPQASDIIISRTLNTGQFPNSTIQMQSPAAMLNALAKDLDETDWDTLANGMLARSALDDVARTGTQAAFPEIDVAGLRAMVADMDANPRAAQYRDMIADAYRKPLEYALEQDYISQSAFDAMIADMPNYVPLRRNVGAEQTGGTLFGGARANHNQQTQLASLLDRTEIEGAGTKVGDAIDPIRGLPEYISNIVRKVEQNNSRREIMDILVNNPEYANVIKRVPHGETSQAPNAINIRRSSQNGDINQEFYIVDDPALYTALTFSNRLGKNVLVDMLSAPTRLVQASLTGPLAPFFQGVVSPAYDMTLGAALRPRGYDLGLISEAANNLVPKLDTIIPGTGTIPTVTRDALNVVGDRLKALDPTVLITPVTGAARLGWDSFLEGQAISLTEQLIRQDGLLYRSLGQQGTRALRDRLTRAYEASVKSQMEQVGASSSGLMLTNTAGQNIDAIANSAPTFMTRASRRAMDDAINGNPGTINSLIQGGNTFANRVGATPFVRGYMNLMRIMGEGFRYQAFATNAAKAGRSAEAAQEIGNQTRRLSGDVFEHGSSELFGQFARTAMYANPAIQGLSQVGRSLKDQPLTTALNITTFGGLAAALQYAAANDPATAEYIASLSPEQQAARIVLAPDVYIPVAQELRNLWAPFALSMNDLTGINEGQYDGAYGRAFFDMLEGDIPLAESTNLDIQTAFDKTTDTMFPINGASFPIINAAAAAAGFDMGMTNYAEQPSEIKAQEVSGLGGNGQLSNDNIAGVDVSATSMAVIEELLSGVTTNFLRTAMDVQRALDADMETEDAVSIGLSRFQDQNARRSGPVRGLLFQDHVFEKSSNTTNSRLYFAKVDGIDQIENIYRSDYSNQAFTSQQDTATARPNEAERVNLQGTALIPILNITHEMSNNLADYRSQISGLNKAIADVRNQTRTSIEDRNAAVNEYREEIEDLTEQSLYIVEQTEQDIRNMIGDNTFTFQNFDPEKYKSIPYPAPTVQ